MNLSSDTSPKQIIFQLIPLLKPDIKNILNAWASVNLKTSLGGTSPKLVEKQIKIWQARLK